MLNVTNLALDPHTQREVSDAGRFLFEHGSSLCNLLDEFDDLRGINGLCDLHIEFEKPNPKKEVVEHALRDIKQVLAQQSPSSLDRLGRERNFYAADATRWHGARVSELLSRLSSED